jgi:hypothetical protein
MFLVKKIRPLPNHADFFSGRFLAEKTLLVGTRGTRVTETFEYCENIQYEIANLLVMVIISLRTTQFLVEPQRGGPDESHPE